MSQLWVAAATAGSCHTRSSRWAVMKMELWVRWSQARTDSRVARAWPALRRASTSSDSSSRSRIPATSPREVFVGWSRLRTQRSTSDIVRPLRCAAYSSGHSRSRATSVKKLTSPRSSTPTVVARARAAFWAPVSVPAARSGDHWALGSRLTPVGSNTLTSPSWRRREMVASTRSSLTEERMAGPSCSRMAEMTLAVLPQRVGPMTATPDRSPWRGLRRRPPLADRARFSVATSLPATRPTISRPGCGPATTRGAMSRGVARRARVSTPRRRRGSVPTPGRAKMR